LQIASIRSALLSVMVMEPIFFLRESALRPYFVNENFYKSKKIRAASFWNDLPWLCNVFQEVKVEICIHILKNFGLQNASNHSRVLHI